MEFSEKTHLCIIYMDKKKISVLWSGWADICTVQTRVSLCFKRKDQLLPKLIKPFEHGADTEPPLHGITLQHISMLWAHVPQKHDGFPDRATTGSEPVHDYGHYVIQLQSFITCMSPFNSQTKRILVFSTHCRCSVASPTNLSQGYLILLTDFSKRPTPSSPPPHGCYFQATLTLTGPHSRCLHTFNKN